MDALPEAIVHIVMVGAVPNIKLRVHFFMIKNGGDVFGYLLRFPFFEKITSFSDQNLIE